jgi:hypothetical protein
MDDVRAPIDIKKTRFMNRPRLFIRSRDLAYQTEKTYCHWVLDYIRLSGRRHPEEIGEATDPDIIQKILDHIEAPPPPNKPAIAMHHKTCSVKQAKSPPPDL